MKFYLLQSKYTSNHCNKLQLYKSNKKLYKIRIYTFWFWYEQTARGDKSTSSVKHLNFVFSQNSHPCYIMTTSEKGKMGEISLHIHIYDTEMTDALKKGCQLQTRLAGEVAFFCQRYRGKICGGDQQCDCYNSTQSKQ